MRRRFAVVLIFGTLYPQLLAQVTQTPRSEPLLGFTAQSSAQEREWEQKFKALPSPQLMRDYMQRLSARPHHVGSPYDKQNAEWILAQFQSWGWDAKIEQFDVLFPTPKFRLLEMTEPTHLRPSLTNRRFRLIRPVARKRSSFPPTTHTRPMVTLLRR